MPRSGKLLRLTRRSTRTHCANVRAVAEAATARPAAATGCAADAVDPVRAQRQTAGQRWPEVSENLTLGQAGRSRLCRSATAKRRFAWKINALHDMRGFWRVLCLP